MGLFKKRSTGPDEIERLRGEIASMASRLNASDATTRQLDSTVAEVRSRLDVATPPPPVPPPPAITADPNASGPDASDSAGAADVAATNERLASLAGDIESLGERLEAVDARITAISTELANQLTELSDDIDAAANSAPPADEIVEQIQGAQRKLAEEQARYQIAFRQDLADIADRLKRS